MSKRREGERERGLEKQREIEAGAMSLLWNPTVRVVFPVCLHARVDGG